MFDISVIRFGSLKVKLQSFFGDLVGSTEVPPKVFLLFSLFSDWLMSNHLKSRIEGGFLKQFFRAMFVALEQKQYK